MEDRWLLSFSPAVNYDAGAGDVVSADFNHVGHLDLATAAGSGANSVSVLLGNGDGTFQPARSWPHGSAG